MIGSKFLRPVLPLMSLIALAFSAHPAAADCTLTSTGKTPLNDLGPALYLGEQGGLYPGGTNTIPAAHLAAGAAIAQAIVPLAADGTSDPANGRVVLVSLGMSNTTQEFASRGPGAFKPRSDADPSRNPKVTVVDCARGGQAAKEWLDPDGLAWTSALQRLSNAGVTPAQVQVMWLKLAERSSDIPDKTFPAHARFHADRLATILRMAKARFPNLRLVFMSSRTRAWRDEVNALNPEPIAYEENFSVKWVIQRQIDGAADLNYDPARGAVLAPFLAWGPYLWIDGDVPRSDGLTWPCSDVVDDFTHPSEAGVWKVGDQLTAFFRGDPLAAPWYLRPSLPHPAPVFDATLDLLQGPAPLTVLGTVSPAGTPLSQITWRYDDGTHAHGAAVTKTFPVPGLYEVRVTASDAAGAWSIRSFKVDVLAPSQSQAQSWPVFH